MALGAVAISQHGPQHLPPDTGDVIAWKFRDPDGHPWEFLQYPTGKEAQRSPGYNHSAISVKDEECSIQFYASLGWRVRYRHMNRGPEQGRLDGLADVLVDVISLAAGVEPPHIELLAYHHPRACAAFQIAPQDIAADRLVLSSREDEQRLIKDPDGHFTYFNWPD